MIDILVCFCNATLKGRADLQRFTSLGWVVLVKAPLFGSFLTSLACPTPAPLTWMTSVTTGLKLRDFGKRSLSLPIPITASSVSSSPTGQDPLRSEEKNKRGFEFKYGGMVVVASNEPVFAGS